MLFAALFALSAYAGEEQDASLPVPRFVSLKAGDVNLRIGPGTRYSINWVYKREGMPVEVIQEFNPWREIRDMDGTTGWVHKQMLQSKRMAIIKSKVVVLRHSPEAGAGAVLKAERGVTGKLLECTKEWCRLQVSGRKGWVKKSDMFGAYGKEVF